MNNIVAITIAIIIVFAMIIITKINKGCDEDHEPQVIYVENQ
jgi:hypothetical protein